MRALRSLGRAVHAVAQDPETKALPYVALGLLLTGTIFYWHFEGWNVYQSLYFSVVTLTTVGYGDLHPSTDFTMMFTVVYIVLGIGVFAALLTSVAQEYIKIKSGSQSARKRASSLRHREKSE